MKLKENKLASATLVKKLIHNINELEAEQMARDFEIKTYNLKPTVMTMVRIIMIKLIRDNDIK